MKSRSSRLFIVLLHLVGVTTHLPSQSDSCHSLSAQTKQTAHSSSSSHRQLTPPLKEINSNQSKRPDVLLLFWVQDETDSVCLGPIGGFSSCGDASIWALLQRPKIHESYSTSSHFEFAIQYVDYDVYHHDKDRMGLSSTLIQPERSQLYPINEAGSINSSSDCLIYISSSISLGDCSSPQAWRWSIDPFGRLNYQLVIDPNNTPSFSWLQQLLGGVALVHAPNPSSYYEPVSAAETSKSITDRHNDPETFTSHERYLLLRSPINNKPLLSPCHETDNELQIHYTSKVIPLMFPSSLDVMTNFAPSTEIESDSTTESLDHSDDTLRTLITHTTSHVKAGVNEDLEPHMHPELKRPSDLLFPNFGRGLISSKKVHPSFSDVIASGRMPYALSPGRNSDEFMRSLLLIHDENRVLHKARKIPSHPYIAVAKDGRYEDPRTGLHYDTDLSDYLGYNNSSNANHGRHTLMGLGHYYRTVLKIKVYGVALYVSKRDVLADPFFIPYASMSPKELTTNDTFYKYLYSDNRKIERTMFLKLNIQISVNSMRASLEADWKLLSSEHKASLIESSFKRRDAELGMLKKIQDREMNPNRCSCGQVAPEMYKADPTCCSRGTVMSFTWLKNGDMELRIDGRVMDTFTSPGMAQGIFHEYLRGDDPISMEARNNFADGFPFLLSPLSIYKSSSDTVASHSNIDRQLESSRNLHVARLALRDKFLSWLDVMITDGMNRLVQISTSIGHYKMQESDRLGTFFNSLYSKSQSASFIPVPTIPLPVSDELEVMNSRPKMTWSRRIFIITVHFYLLLLMVVSIPDSFPTKVLVSKKSTPLSSLDSESDNEERNNPYDDDSVGSMNCVLQRFNTNNNARESLDELNTKPMKKALSYCF